MNKILSMTRDADRRELTARVTDLAKRYDCTVEVTAGGSYPGPKAIHVQLVAPGGLSVNIRLDGARPKEANSFVLSWHMDLDSSNKLSSRTFLNVNPYHHLKATDTCTTPQLLELLERRFKAAQDGTAYMKAPELA